MAQYILLLHLTPAGREAMVADPQTLTRAANATESEGVNALGLYAVLGRYDFVCILDAPDNEAAATYSLELGVRAGAVVETLPAVPIGLLGGAHRRPVDDAPEARGLPESVARRPDREGLASIR